MMAVLTLFDSCMSKIASLLIDCYWPFCYTSSTCTEKNQFSYLPSHINEELISAVIQLTPSGTLSVRHLYLILSSGRVRNFKLEDILLSTEQFVAILTTLSVVGTHLLKVILRKIYCIETPEDKCFAMQSKAIECLLSLSPNLEYIEIDKEFDLKVIQKIGSLKHLDLNFVPKNELFDLIPEYNSLFIPNVTILYISIFEGYPNRIPVEEIAFLLQYCPNLTNIENSIAGALELMHGEELCRGFLEKRYKLQKYTLGNAFVNTSDSTASVNVIHIATVTCPLTKHLDILVNDHQAIAALGDFKNLQTILIQWEKPNAGDFRLGLQNVLKCIGSQMNELSIINFCHIDFEVVGISCPKLKSLKVEYDDELNISENTEISFENLESLHLQCEHNSGVKRETLMLLLSNCALLTSLSLDNVKCLNDDLLDIILKKNSFVKLKEASLTYCCITKDGLRKMVAGCPALEFLCFHSLSLPFEEAIGIIHEANPFVIVCERV